jgi:hypothetical protein
MLARMSLLGLSTTTLPTWLVSTAKHVRIHVRDLDVKLSIYLCWASLALLSALAMETVFHWIWPGVITSRVAWWTQALQTGLVAGLATLGLGILVRSAWLMHRCRQALLSTTNRAGETLALWRGSWGHACDACDNLLMAWPWCLAFGTLLLAQKFEMTGIAAIIASCAFALGAFLARNKAWEERLSLAVFLVPILLVAIAVDVAETRRTKNKTRVGAYNWGKDYEAIPEALRNTMERRAQDIVFGASNEPAFHRAMVKSFNGGRFTAMEQASQLQASVLQVRPVSAAPPSRRL